MSPSADPNPVTASSLHAPIRDLPCSPVAPKIVIRMRQVLYSSPQVSQPVRKNGTLGQTQAVLRILGRNPLSIPARGYVFHPLLVSQIPLHGLAQAGFETLIGFPAEFTLDLAGIDRIPSVVSRTVLHKRNQFSMGHAGGIRTAL